ncbi:MAG: DMT family transporter [Erysipelotrichaceae bacterium]
MNKLSSVITGALIAIMIVANGQLAALFGNALANVLVQVIGLMFTCLFFLLRKERFVYKAGIPLFWYLGGIFGVLSVYLNNITFISLGVALTSAVGLLGQSLSSFVIDLLGLFDMPKKSFHFTQLMGLSIIFIGIVLMLG